MIFWAIEVEDSGDNVGANEVIICFSRLTGISVEGFEVVSSGAEVIEVEVGLEVGITVSSVVVTALSVGKVFVDGAFDFS